MMSPLLPARDLATIRAVARTAAVLLVAVRINQIYPGRAIADYEIADILETDKRTVQKQLRSLSAAGLMLEQFGKYVVTIAGVNTLFGVADMENPYTTSLSIEEGKNTIEVEAVRTQNVQFMNDDDRFNDSDSDSSSSFIPERTKCAQVLEFSHLLFGEAVSDKCLDETSKLDWVLCWVNKAYRDREKLNNPQGLVYKRILAKESPPMWLRKNPTQGLPDNFLDAIGLFNGKCVRCEKKFNNSVELAEHQKACVMTHFDEVEEDECVSPDESVDSNVRDAWGKVLEDLKNVLPKAQFQTWVADTFPVHFGEGKFSVGVRNSYAVGWLMRLNDEVCTLLAKYLQKGLQVEWVVAVEVEGV